MGLDTKNSVIQKSLSSDDFANNPESWPALPLEAWQETYATLHMWTQIVGKVRLALSPLINHWWEVPLYVSARGLTTSAIPYQRGIFEVEFDFLKHNLVIQTSEGSSKTIPLKPRSVADFYKEFMAALAGLGIEVKIWHMPVEVPNPIAFDLDTQHASYDREYVTRFWRILWYLLTMFSRNSVRASWERAVRYISFGEVSIWRSPASPDGAPRSAKGLTRLRAKLTRMR